MGGSLSRANSLSAQSDAGLEELRIGTGSRPIPSSSKEAYGPSRAVMARWLQFTLEKQVRPGYPGVRAPSQKDTPDVGVTFWIVPSPLNVSLSTATCLR